jgi:hypothetical protein
MTSRRRPIETTADDLSTDLPPVIPTPTADPTDPPPNSAPDMVIADLKPDPQNRRKRTPRNVAMIVDALKSVGAARSIVIDEDDIVLAGNGVTDAASQVGITKVRVVEAEGDEIIAVRRRGLTPEQKRDLALFDNRTGELAEWDVEQLAADHAAGLDLKPFFTDIELRKMKVVAFAPDNQPVPGQFLVVITCTDEQEQVALLDRFAQEGLACKALVS